jgi:hypothetical protein
MKKILLASLVITSFASFAQTKLPAGVEYSRAGTMGEYPAAFKVVGNTTISIAKTAAPQAVKTVKCDLKKGKKIIFAKSTVVTHSYTTGKFEVLKDTFIEVTNNDGSADKIIVAAGKTVENVSYYSEGYCDVRFEGKEYEAPCMGQSNEDGSLKVVSELDSESWVKLSCANGTKGWVNQKSLETAPKLESFLYNPYNSGN